MTMDREKALQALDNIKAQALEGVRFSDTKIFDFVESNYEVVRSALTEQEEFIKGPGVGSSLLIRSATDEDGKPLIIMAEWYYKEIMKFLNRKLDEQAAPDTDIMQPIFNGIDERILQHASKHQIAEKTSFGAPDAVDERGILHNAFWEAYKNLDENIRKRFSIHTGRKFANEIYDELLKRRAK